MKFTDWTRPVLVIAALGLVLAALFGWKHLQMRTQQSAQMQARPPLPVEATRALQESWAASLTTTGSLRAVNGIRVANEVAGIVESIEVTSGQAVEAGAVLATLNADTDRAALATLRAERKLAQRDFERLTDLLAQRAVSQADFDAATAKLEAAEARLLAQQATLDKKTIRAPFSGVAGLRLVDRGEFLETGTAIVEVVTADPIYVDFTISERALTLVHPGNTLQVEVAAFAGETYAGQVEALNASVNPDSRTLQIRGRLPTPDHRLREGMFAQVQVFSGDADPVVTVPRTAISYNTYGDFVYLIVEEGGATTVQRRQVTTGEVRDGRVAVLAGLAGGERIIATGLHRLRNDQAVTIAGAPASSDRGDSE